MVMPRHVALIPDGNRRWARAKGLAASDGHRHGIRNVGKAAQHCFERGVEVFSFWWGSPANLTKRESGEVAVIVDCLGAWLRDECPAVLTAHAARLEVIGRWRELCPELGPAVASAERAAGAGPSTLGVLMAYDGRDEIMAAAGAAGNDRAAFEQALQTSRLGPVDLVIRTGGTGHLSAGFMLWQIAEATLHFSEKRWPDFGVDDLDAALAAYSTVERRYGG